MDNQPLHNRKIVFILSQFPCYDETFILRELGALKKRGLSFNIFSLKTPKDRIVQEEAYALLEDTMYLPLVSLKHLAAFLYFVFTSPVRLVRVLFLITFGLIGSPDFLFKTWALLPKILGLAYTAKKDRVGWVHGQWATHPATAALVVSRLTDIPFSFTGHAHDIYLDTTMLVKKMAMAHFITTCTAHNKEYLLSVASPKLGPAQTNPLSEKVVVNYHGVDLIKFKPISKRETGGPVKILSVGSLLECKGFDLLIEACRLLKEQGISFTATIAGGGPWEQRLQSQARQSGLEKEIVFTGFITQEQLIPHYQAADIFALPVRLEVHWGIPNVCLEAMAAKVPVITTGLPSIPEIITDGKSGLIVPEKDPKAVAAALKHLIKNPQLRRNLAESGYRIIQQHFDLQKNADRLISLFRQRGA